MRVIQQLVDYLTARGYLGPLELAYLRRHGFLADDSDEARPADKASAPPTVDPSADLEIRWLELQEELERARLRERREVARGRARRSLRRRQVAEQVPALVRRLAALLPSWEAEQVGLGPLARRLGGEPAWPVALTAIHAAPAPSLDAALAEALADASPSLAELWPTVAFRAEADLLDDESLPAPERGALRGLLRAAEADVAPGYAWLLQDPALRALSNLVRARAALRSGFYRLYQQRPEVLAAALRRDFHPQAYLVLLLFYNAERLAPAGPAEPVEAEADLDGPDQAEVEPPVRLALPPPAPHEVYPRRPLPERRLLLRSLVLALLIQPRALLPLLGRHREFWPALREAATYQEIGLVCPRGWRF